MAKVSTEEKLSILTQAITERKGESVEVIDLREKTLIADYFVVLCGNSNIHIKAIVDGIRRKFKEKRLKRPDVEGYSEAKWVLLDFGDIVVHIFSPEEREFYDIETLWRQVEERRGAAT